LAEYQDTETYEDNNLQCVTGVIRHVGSVTI